MSHYKPYPTYKDSGVEWLGQVPEHWIVSRLRHITNGSLSYGANEAAESDDLRHPRFIRITDLNEDGTLREDTFKSLPPDVARPYLLKDGDILLARSGATVGKSFLYRRDMGDACYAGYLIRARLLESKFIPKLFWYCTQSSYYWDFIAGSNIQATIQNVSGEKYSNLWLAVPPVTEQRSIVSNLDRETARIDALIEKKTRVIELLREKRQALITHAVTKGLDPNVKMKDSGVEWLGDVPEHWRVMAIKHIVATPITDGPHETPEFLDEGVPFVSAEAVSSGRVDFAKIRGFISRNDHERYSQKYCPQRGDIFMIKSGATTGVTAIVETDDEFNIWSPLAVIRCGELADPYFVLNFMRSQSFQEAVALSWSYGTQQNIGMGVIGNLAVTVPPLEEQQRIAQLAQGKCSRLDALVEKTECSIDLLKERRSALITAAVTGQIDLR